MTTFKNPHSIPAVPESPVLGACTCRGIWFPQPRCRLQCRLPFLTPSRVPGPPLYACAEHAYGGFHGASSTARLAALGGYANRPACSQAAVRSTPPGCPSPVTSAPAFGIAYAAAC